jgi:hypothetical protein
LYLTVLGVGAINPDFPDERHSVCTNRPNLP